MTFRSTSLLGAAVLAALAVSTALADEPRPLFDGATPAGSILTDGSPLPAKFIQDGAMNPHGSGSYIVCYKEKLGDFVADLDYKLSKGCNSGVFIRVNDLKNPVYSGIEIAIDDTRGVGMHDPGAFYDLVPPRVNAQKPAGEWNHMTITARGPHIKVEINGEEVSTINLDEWNEPGKRPDGTKHKFGVAIGKLAREGYLGFQDHGRDCWYKNVTLRKP